MNTNHIMGKVKGRLKSFVYGGIIKRYKYFNFGLGLNRTKRIPRVIVSLTTYGIRLNTVHICIKSILSQSYRPDKVILYLGNDVDPQMIPKELQKLTKYGLTIVTGCENIKPHKKYYYSMKQYPNDIIVTVDDDVIYEKDTIKKLVEGHEKYPNAIICTRGVFIQRESDGKLLPYSKWRTVEKPMDEPTMGVLPTGVGGVLYPPKVLCAEVFNVDLIKELCLEADDVWLRMMGVLNHVPVYFVRMRDLHPWPIPETEKIALTRTNVGENRNDIFISRVENYFQIGIDGRCLDE